MNAERGRWEPPPQLPIGAHRCRTERGYRTLTTPALPRSTDRHVGVRRTSPCSRPTWRKDEFSAAERRRVVEGDRYSRCTRQPARL